MAAKFESERRKINEYAHAPEEGSYIAGGAVTSVFTSQPINDIDVYFKDRTSFERGVEFCYDNALWCVDISDRSITFVDGTQVIQLMHFAFFPTAQDIFDTFDFTCCMGSYEPKSKEFVFDDRFFQHCSQRHLSFHAETRFPFASLLRVLKYQQRGYSIGKGDLLKIILACHRTPLTSWDDLKAQIGGSYGHHIALAAQGEFSIEAAIQAVQDINFDAKTESVEEMPGSWEQAIERIYGPEQIAA